MPDPRHEHGSGVRPSGEQPGAHSINPYGVTKGVTAVVPTVIPAPPERSPAVQAKVERDTRKASQPAKRGRPLGSKNRPPIDPEMFDAPPDES